MSLIVAILAGGFGRRIGGGKPGRLLGGSSLLSHALKAARAVAAPTILVVRDLEQAEGFKGTVVLDTATIPGPLGGLHSALTSAEAAGADRVLTLPCDMPFLPSDFGAKLTAALTDDFSVAVAASGGRLHPICALWRTTAAKTLVERADRELLSLHGLSEAVGRVVVEWPIEDVDPFLNINTAEDLAAAEQVLT